MRFFYYIATGFYQTRAVCYFLQIEQYNFGFFVILQIVKQVYFRNISFIAKTYKFRKTNVLSQCIIE